METETVRPSGLTLVWCRQLFPTLLTRWTPEEKPGQEMPVSTSQAQGETDACWNELYLSVLPSPPTPLTPCCLWQNMGGKNLGVSVCICLCVCLKMHRKTLFLSLIYMISWRSTVCVCACMQVCACVLCLRRQEKSLFSFCTYEKRILSVRPLTNMALTTFLFFLSSNALETGEMRAK